MYLHRTFFTIVLLALICSLPALADSDVLSQSTDSRLNQKVDFAADGLRVSEALGGLALKTGVNMAAGVDENDWMVRDRKIIVYVNRMPLRDLMQEIASILHFQWISTGSGADVRYALLQSDDQTKEEQSLRDSTMDAQAKQFRERRQNVLSDMTNLGALGKGNTAKLADTDPWRYVLASEPLGRDIAKFFSLFPDAHKAFLQGTEVSFSVSELSSDLQATVRSIAQSYDSLQQRIGASEDHADLLSKFDKLQVTIDRNFAANASGLMAKGILGGLNVGMGTDTIYIPILDPASGMAKALGRAIVRLQSGLSKDEVGKQLEAELKQETDVSERKRDITSDPALKKTIALYPTDTISPLTDTLKSLASKTGMDIISDYFAAKPPAIADGEKSIGEQLETIRVAYGSNWEKSGSILRFRDGEWFTKRAWEVPQVWIDYWIARGKTNNGLLLEDLVQIARLRDAQIDHTIIIDPILVGLGAGEAARNRDILRFYASLSYEQQKTMATQRLEVSAITDDQWTILEKALAAKGAAYAAAAKGSQYVQLTQSGDEVIDYRIVYYPSPNDPPVEFKMTSGNVYGIADKNTISGNK